MTAFPQPGTMGRRTTRGVAPIGVRVSNPASAALLDTAHTGHGINVMSVQLHE